MYIIIEMVDGKQVKAECEGFVIYPKRNNGGPSFVDGMRGEATSHFDRENIKTVSLFLDDEDRKIVEDAQHV